MAKSKSDKTNKLTKLSQGMGFVFFILLVCLLILGAYLLALDLFYKNRFYPRTEIAGINVSGMTKNEVRDLLYSRVAAINAGLGLQYKCETQTVLPENIGLYIDVEKTIGQTFRVGRDSLTWQAISDRLSLLYSDEIVSDLELQIDEQVFASFLDNDLEYGYPARDATLSYQDGDFIFVEGKDGKGLNKRYLLALLQNRFSNLSAESIKVPVDDIHSRVTSREINRARLETITAISAPLKLKFQDREWEIESSTIAEWADFKVVPDANLATADYLPKDNFDLDNFVLASLGQTKWVSNKSDYVLAATLNRDQVGAYLDEIAQNIDIPARNAKLQMVDGELVVSAPAEKGREVLIDGTFTALEERAKTWQRELNILTRETGADVTAENVADLGIKELIATGQSNFVGSPSNRRHNIQVGADRLNGILIKPGEEFSLIQELGEINAEAGYLPELVIKENKTIPEYGGGLCQIATTNFRAVVNAGLDITERKSHSYAVSYYTPHGTDATIYDPHPDLRFINNTPAYILLQTKIKGNILTFELYGTSDGREVELVGPTYWDRRSDGSFKAQWTQIVRQDGVELYRQKFVSYYDSPAKYH